MLLLLFSRNSELLVSMVKRLCKPKAESSSLLECFAEVQPIFCKDNIIIGKMQIDVVVFLSGNYILALI